MEKNKFILILIIIFAIFLRLPQIISDQFPFIFDTGRDILWVRDMVVLKKIYLIGSWSALSGVFFGPAWYYLLAIPFSLTQGDPRGGAYLIIFFNLATILISYFLGKRIKDDKLGLIFALILSSSAMIIGISKFIYSPNLLPFTTIVFVWCLYESLTETTKVWKYFALAAFMASLNFHFEPATAIFTSLTLLVFFLWQFKYLLKPKLIFSSILAFLIPFVPQIIFELRHQFLQTKSVIGYLSGNNRMEGQLPFLARIQDRLNKFVELFGGSVLNIPSKWLLILGLLLILVIIYLVHKSENKKVKNFIKVNLIVLLTPLVCYIFIFPPELKTWYLYGLTVPYILLTGLVFYWLMKRNAMICYALLALLIFINSRPDWQLNFILRKSQIQEKPEILATQKKVIDWIYEDAKNQPFSVYVYTPPIYEFHYQYLFWWYAKSKFGYWPEDYSYLPGKTDYVNFKDKYNELQHQAQPAEKPAFFYLIMEDEPISKRIRSWKNNFTESRLLFEKQFGPGLVIEKRK